MLPTEQTSVACYDNTSQSISCVDNLIGIRETYFGFRLANSCDSSTTYQPGDCLLSYESVVGSEFDQCDGNREHCRFISPTATDLECSGVAYDHNLYFLVLYQCITGKTNTENHFWYIYIVVFETL
jgi:hypothetical protein